MKLKHWKMRTFWTIWAIGYHRIKDFRGQTSELQLFIGPAVLTLWR